MSGVLDAVAALAVRDLDAGEAELDLAVRALVLDWHGCRTSAAAGAEGRRTVRALHGPRDGGSPALAERVLADAFLCHLEEFDAFLPGSAMCPAGLTVPVALAVAPLSAADDATVVRGIARGAACLALLGSVFAASSLYRRRWWPSAVFGAAGAAVTATSVLGAAPEVVREAVGLASGAVGGVIPADGRMASHYLGYGRAAVAGVQAALLAVEGVTGTHTLWDEVLPDAVGVSPKLDAGDPDAAWAWPSVTVFKPYPVARPLHAMIDALTACAVPAERVRRVAVRLPDPVLPILHERTHPTTYAEAVTSVPFVAWQALRGQAHDPRAYRASRDGAPVEPPPGTLRVEIAGDAALTRGYPQRWGAVVEVTTVDGTVVEQAVADGWGGPERPLRYDDVARKWRALTDAAADERAAAWPDDLPDRVLRDVLAAAGGWR